MSLLRNEVKAFGATSETSSVGGLGHVAAAVHPVGDGRPVLLGDRLNQLPEASVLADGDGEADIHLAADDDQGVGIEATVGPHRELSCKPHHGAPGPPFHAGSGRRPERCWPGPREAETSARRRCRRRWPAAGDSPAGRCNHGDAPPPWPVRSIVMPVSGPCRGD